MLEGTFITFLFIEEYGIIEQRVTARILETGSEVICKHSFSNKEM